MDKESNAGVEAEEAEEVDGGAAIDAGVEEDESLSSEDSDDDSEVEEEEPDWQAIAEQERIKAENYKRALTQKRQLRKRKPEEEAPEEDIDESEEDEDDENRPVTLKDLEKRDAQKTVESTLAELVKDPEKRKLVKLYYDTRIRQTGTSDDAILSDLQTALDIADAKHLRKTSSEMARAANKDKTPPLGGSASDRSPASKDHKFSEDQVRALTETAKRIGADPKKFIAEAYKNQQVR